ncbi:restriction system modified-DNA reader domain-containing protein [Streptomyces sp. NPDC001273]|uniref:restriction system modified-DNA reader domain-containing protein n=1 Tax=unclassified Streptomyces TaxID=2593676 RepID=UPI0033CCAEED
MSPTIRVDDEVYEELQKRATPFVDTPNSTLRRVLGLPEKETQSGSAMTASSSPEPALRPLLADRRLRPGQRLVWRRRNLNREHYAEVLEDGTLRLEDGSVHGTPSSAATALAGNSQNGWTAFATEDGALLRDLR